MKMALLPRAGAHLAPGLANARFWPDAPQEVLSTGAPICRILTVERENLIQMNALRAEHRIIEITHLTCKIFPLYPRTIPRWVAESCERDRKNWGMYYGYP